MSYNESYSSKVASVRIPLPEYEQMLQNAADNHMSISDYLLQILYKQLNGILVELNEDEEICKKGIVEGLKICLKLQNESENALKKKNKELLQKCKELRDRNRRQKSTIEALRYKYDR